jgi:hypothetical protein
MSDLSAATLTALKASASISADADPALNLADPGMMHVDPVIAWPSTDDLTTCQLSAIEKLKPFIQSRSAPNYSFLVLGGAGTGKSYFISHLKACCDAVGVVLGHFGLRSGAYAAAAGMVLPNGQTLHSLVGLSTKKNERGHNEEADYANVFPKNPSAEVLISLRAAWKNVGLLIIDEISMVSRPLLGCVSHRLSLILDNDADFGGLLVVMISYSCRLYRNPVWLPRPYSQNMKNLLVHRLRLPILFLQRYSFFRLRSKNGVAMLIGTG